MSSGIGLLGGFLIFSVAVTIFVLLVVFVAVPLFQGIGAVIGATFRGIGWLINHIFEFVGGVFSDAVRFIGSLIAMAVLLPLVPLNIMFGRWSAAGHFAERVKAECQIGAACVYRVVLRRPLKFLLLHGLLEGLEQRVPEAMHAAPGSDKPSRRTGQFEGYTIVGSLRSGGSGAKLYVAEPTPEKRRAYRGSVGMPDQVVIKSFAITEGSSLPQIVRESRALECAKQLGHVLDHGMDEHRFYYVMPYHPGDHLGILTRQMHGECGGRGLDRRRLQHVMSYTHDLLTTLAAYHKGGLWHKDIKPENIIVHDGRAHVVDLGLVTPLKSAMTLTTHGTEYFRDPEMVRQALRGVKVHQVDGAKFDIYAAGAVLYFMIENTFPAHGGLSRFTLPSPEALRWIVRRAMTEYHQRYQNVDAMLADLNFVMHASDPFAVKPADLPSMCSEHEAADAPSVEEPAFVVGAASATPPLPPQHASWRASAADADGAADKSSHNRAGIDGNAPRHGGWSDALRRPRLTVTNWWTGAYRVDDPAADDDVEAAARADMHAQARMFREHAYAFRDHAEQISRQVRAGAISARRAAREQVKAARARAREIRNRAAAHRHRVTGRRHGNTSASTIIIGLLSILFLGSIIVMGIFSPRNSERRAAAFITTATDPGRPVLLLLDGADPNRPEVRSRVERVVAEYTQQGFDVVVHDWGVQPELVQLVNAWWKDQNGLADELIEDVLEAHNLYGILHVQVDGRDRRSLREAKVQLISSTRKDAAARRRTIVTGPTVTISAAPPALPYLLINDHPAKADPKVQQQVRQIVSAYRDTGWNIADDNLDAEVELRKYLPTGPIDPKLPLSPMLEAALAEFELGGILRIDLGPGDGAPADRIVVTRIDRDTLTAAPIAPVPSNASGSGAAR